MNRVLLGLFALGVIGCHPIPEHAEGVNLFPLYRSATFPGTEDSLGNPDRELDILWPLFHSSRHGDRSNFRFLLYSTDREDPFFESTWFFPFYHRFRDIDRDEFVLAPFYGKRRDGWRTIHQIVPFWLDSVAELQWDRDRRMSRLRFLFNEWERAKLGPRVSFLDVFGLAHLLEVDMGRPRQTDSGEEGVTLEAGTSVSLVSALGLFELFSGSTEGAYRDFSFVQLFGNEVTSLFRFHRRHLDEVSESGAGQKRGDGTTHLFPIYFASRDSSSLDGKPSGSFHLWPFYGRQWEDGGGETKHHILYPFFGWGRDGQGELSGLDLLWPLARYRRMGDASQWKFFWIPVGDDLDESPPSNQSGSGPGEEGAKADVDPDADDPS